jgi:hypothetical protein
MNDKPTHTLVWRGYKMFEGSRSAVLERQQKLLSDILMARSKGTITGSFDPPRVVRIMDATRELEG